MNKQTKIGPYDTTPGTRMLEAIINKRWSVKLALAEIIDNSYGQITGQASTIFICWNQKTKTLYVLDDGLGIEEPGEVYKLGSGSKNKYDPNSGDIGRWGVGATDAILWLAHEVSVHSLRGNDMKQSNVNWDDVIKTNVWPQLHSDWTKVSKTNPAPTEFARHKVTQGTLIKMRVRSASPHNRAIKPSILTGELSRMYGPGLREGKHIVWQTLNGKTVEEFLLKDPIIAPDKHTSAKPVVLDGTNVTCGGVTLPISGRVYYSTETPKKDWGIDLCYGYRIIESNVGGWYIDENDRRHQANHVSGRVKLEGRGWLEHMSQHKDGITDHDMERALYAAVYEKIKGLLTESEHRVYSLRLRGLEKALAASLARSMNKRSDLADSDPDTYKQPPRTGTRPIKPPKDDDDKLPPVDPDAVKKPRTPSTRPPNAKRRAGSVATISIQYVPGAIMRPEKSLAYATADLAKIQAWVNIEDPTMLDAFERNHALLNYTIVGEIAAAMSLQPDPAAFFQDDERKNKLDGAEPNKARLLIISYMMKDIVDAPAEEPEEEKTPEFVPTYELVKAVVS